MVVRHRAGPHFGGALRGDDVIRVAPRRRQLPLLHALGRGVEHTDGVVAVLGEPQAALVVEPAAPRPRALARDRPDLDLAGLGVAAADVGVGELHHVDAVALVRGQAVAADLPLAEL